MKKRQRNEIQNLYSINEKRLDDTNADLVASFLSSISNEYEEDSKFNYQHLTDRTIQYFKKNNLMNLSGNIEKLSELGFENIEEAEKLVIDFNRVDKTLVDGIDPFLIDAEQMKNAFVNDSQPLFTYPGALGQMVNNLLCRDSFIAFLGPSKRGKTWYLLDMAMRALIKRRNVIFFQAGDMTEGQQLRRIGMYVCRKSYLPKHSGKILKPVLDCWKNQLGECSLSRSNRGIIKNLETKELENFYDIDSNDYSPCKKCLEKNDKKYKGASWFTEIQPGRLDWGEAYQGIQLWKKRRIGKTKFELATYPNKTLTVKTMETVLENLEHTKDFIPDVIIVDYADIMVASNSKLPPRDANNDIWQSLRSLSQKKRCLVITATQADAKSYEKKNLSAVNFSEDRRKIDHVTGLMGLNQMPDEKRKGIMRINNIVVRDDEFDITQNVKVLQCLQIGRPFLGSYF